MRGGFSGHKITGTTPSPRHSLIGESYVSHPFRQPAHRPAMCGPLNSRFVTECDTPVRPGRGVVNALASEALAQDRERGFVHPQDAGVVLGFP